MKSKRFYKIFKWSICIKNTKKLLCMLCVVSIEEDVNAHENDGIDTAETRPEGIFCGAVNDGGWSPGCETAWSRAAEASGADTFTSAHRLTAVCPAAECRDFLQRDFSLSAVVEIPPCKITCLFLSGWRGQ